MNARRFKFYFGGLPGFFWLGVVGILSPFVLLVFFAQPSADDFCIAASAKQGFLAAQVDWYANWTGRFSMVAVATALALFGRLESVYWVGCLIFLVGTGVAAWCVIDRFAGPVLPVAPCCPVLPVAPCGP